MKTFTCTFRGHFIAGHAVVIAHTLEEAVTLLNERLQQDDHRLLGGAPLEVLPEDFQVINTRNPHAVVLSDGNY